MTSTAPPRVTDSTPPAETPDSTADRIEQELADRADDVRQPVDRIHRALETIREQVDELRGAGAAYLRLEVETALLAGAHGVDLDLPALDLEAALDDAEAALEAVAGTRVRCDSLSERRGRSAGKCLPELRQAVRDGRPDEAASRITRLRRLLDDPAWLTDELVADTFLEPARERYRERLERDLVRQALRVARSFGQGNPVPLRDEDGEPVRFPAPVVELIEEQIAEPRSFVSLFLREIDHPRHRDVSGRDLEDELAEAVAMLPDETLEAVLR